MIWSEMILYLQPVRKHSWASNTYLIVQRRKIIHFIFLFYCAFAICKKINDLYSSYCSLIKHRIKDFRNWFVILRLLHRQEIKGIIIQNSAILWMQKIVSCRLWTFQLVILTDGIEGFFKNLFGPANFFLQFENY